MHTSHILIIYYSSHFRLPSYLHLPIRFFVICEICDTDGLTTCVNKYIHIFMLAPINLSHTHRITLHKISASAALQDSSQEYDVNAVTDSEVKYLMTSILAGSISYFFYPTAFSLYITTTYRLRNNELVTLVHHGLVRASPVGEGRWMSLNSTLEGKAVT